MKKKYNCPVCGKVPVITSSNAKNIICCCNIIVKGSWFFECLSKWKRVCDLVEHVEVVADSHGLPITNIDIPMPEVKQRKCKCAMGVAEDGVCVACGGAK
jgi:hypothetical protein